MLDWNDLRYFLAVHRERSLAGASRVLGVDQTTVGRRIAAMEEALGVRLFVRQPRTMSLAPAGEAILAAAKRVEEQMTTLARAAEGEDARPGGTVRITANECFANRLIVPTLGALHSAHPGLHVELLCDSRKLDIGKGEADVAVRVGHAEQDALVARRVGTCAFGLYASTDYLRRRGWPRGLHDLEGHDLVGYATNLGFLGAAQWLEKVGRPGQKVFRGNTMLSVTAGAGAGLGTAVLPCFLGETEPGLVRVAPDDRVTTMDVWLVVHPDLVRVARVRLTLRHLEQVFSACSGMLEGAPRSASCGILGAQEAP